MNAKRTILGATCIAAALTFAAIGMSAGQGHPKQTVQDGWSHTVLQEGKARAPLSGTDGWYYTALRTGKRDGTASSSFCKTNRIYQQAMRAGELPAIVAALHGGAAPAGISLVGCK